MPLTLKVRDDDLFGVPYAGDDEDEGGEDGGDDNTEVTEGGDTGSVSRIELWKFMYSECCLVDVIQSGAAG